MLILIRATIAILALLASFPAAAQRACDQFRSSTTTSPSPLTETIAAVAGQRVYLCGFAIINSGASLTISLFSGTGINCATNQAVLVSAITMPANTTFVNRIPIAAGEYTPIGHAVCLQVTGSGNLTTLWYWTQF